MVSIEVNALKEDILTIFLVRTLTFMVNSPTLNVLPKGSSQTRFAA